MVASSQLAGGGYFSCSICMCGWLLLLCDWLSCWQYFWPGYTLWHYFSSRRLMGWLYCFVLPDSIFQYSLFSSLRQSWLCGCLLMMFVQLQAFLPLYTAVKGTVVCRYLCVYSCKAVHGYVPPTSCMWICFCTCTCACMIWWMCLCLCAYTSNDVSICIVCVYLNTHISQCEWICVHTIYRKNCFRSIIKVVKSKSRYVKIL